MSSLFTVVQHLRYLYTMNRASFLIDVNATIHSTISTTYALHWNSSNYCARKFSKKIYFWLIWINKSQLSLSITILFTQRNNHSSILFLKNEQHTIIVAFTKINDEKHKDENKALFRHLTDQFEDATRHPLKEKQWLLASLVSNHRCLRLEGTIITSYINLWITALSAKVRPTREVLWHFQDMLYDFFLLS